MREIHWHAATAYHTLSTQERLPKTRMLLTSNIQALNEWATINDAMECLITSN